MEDKTYVNSVGKMVESIRKLWFNLKSQHEFTSYLPQLCEIISGSDDRYQLRETMNQLFGIMQRVLYKQLI